MLNHLISIFFSYSEANDVGSAPSSLTPPVLLLDTMASESVMPTVTIHHTPSPSSHHPQQQQLIHCYSRYQTTTSTATAANNKAVSRREEEQRRTPREVGGVTETERDKECQTAGVCPTMTSGSLIRLPIKQEHSYSLLVARGSSVSGNGRILIRRGSNKIGELLWYSLVATQRTAIPRQGFSHAVTWRMH